MEVAGGFFPFFQETTQSEVLFLHILERGPHWACARERGGQQWTSSASTDTNDAHSLRWPTKTWEEE